MRGPLSPLPTTGRQYLLVMPSRPGRHRHASVALAWIRSAQVDGPFMDSVLEVGDYDQLHQGYLNRQKGGGRIVLQSSPRIAEARSQVVDNFLKEFPDADWLWWVDSDATFDGDVLARLMEVAHYPDRPIVGALAFAGARAANMYPTLYGAEQFEDGIEITRPETDYPRDALVKVAGTGCHCVVVHKQVFRALAKSFATMPNGAPNPYPWYAEGLVDRKGAPIGEDMIFCWRARGLGIPTHVHTGIKTGHVKQAVLDEALWEERMVAKPLPPMQTKAAELPPLDLSA